MKNYKILTIIIIFCLVLTYTPSIKAEGGGAGVLPSIIIIEDVLKGETAYKRNIRIVNAGNDTAYFNLNSSSNMKDWIKIYDYEDINLTESLEIIEVPAKTKRSLLVTFTVPKTEANGMYRGTIFVERISSKEINYTGIKLQLPIEIFLNITGDQRIDGKILSISTENTEVGIDLEFLINFQNTGNVVARPIIEITIYKNGWLVDEIRYSSIEVPVETGKYLRPKWQTNNQQIGEYIANIKVKLGSELLESKNVSFSLLPRGTITRSGELINFTCSKDKEIGKTLILESKFINTGLIEITAECIIEIYRDNTLENVIKSNDQPTVKIRGEYTFVNYYLLNEPGEYKFINYINYENNKTSAKIITFNVNIPIIIQMIPIIFIVFLCFIVLFYLIRKNQITLKTLPSIKIKPEFAIRSNKQSNHKNKQQNYNTSKKVKSKPKYRIQINKNKSFVQKKKTSNSKVRIDDIEDYIDSF